ncbi:uncharacterized protein EV420DRAFT_922266 [Desarmillaria tabescens]|uniref:Uncharacterized protein n=1 Tax=Armillaria tabescens TaxID=1929756 RepID=A0AA39JNP4_ARMTA|nr:uncharacterized protein EV420DRAFT_922266 [Desarmillaria tabescens]KAK0445647.1 hypothetical protein EV420DRAFT_922266 [Desarmillaria tabescens]
MSADGLLCEGSHQSGGTRCFVHRQSLFRRSLPVSCSWFPFHCFHGLRLEHRCRHAVLRNSGPRLLCSPDACVSFLQSVVLCFLVDDSYAPIVLDIFSLLLTCNFPYTPWSVYHVSLSRYVFLICSHVLSSSLLTHMSHELFHNTPLDGSDSQRSHTLHWIFEVHVNANCFHSIVYPAKSRYSARRTQQCGYNGMSLRSHSAWFAMSGLRTRPFLIGTWRR